MNTFHSSVNQTVWLIAPPHECGSSNWQCWAGFSRNAFPTELTESCDGILAEWWSSRRNGDHVCQPLLCCLTGCVMTESSCGFYWFSMYMHWDMTFIFLICCYTSSSQFFPLKLMSYIVIQWFGSPFTLISLNGITFPVLRLNNWICLRLKKINAA